MKSLNTAALILAAYLGAFVAASDHPLSRLLGIRFDVLPPLMVYCGLTAGWGAITLIALLSGLWLDSLSANKLGVSVLPLFLVSFTLRTNRSLILRDQTQAQVVLGLLASAIVPVLTLVLLLGTGQKPLVGWGSAWPWLAATLIGGALTPLLFYVLDQFNRAFNYSAAPETTFRQDREIKRGRL